MLYHLLPVRNVHEDLCLWLERLPVIQEQHLRWLPHCLATGKNYLFSSQAKQKELGQDGSQAEGGKKNESHSLHLAPLQACFVRN